MSAAKWVQLVIWSGGLIYISDSPPVFIFACEISAWPDIKNAKCQSENIQSQRLKSSVPDQHANQWHRFFSGRKTLLSLTVRLTDHLIFRQAVRQFLHKNRLVAPMHSRQWNITRNLHRMSLHCENAVKHFSLPKVIKWDRKSGDVLTFLWVKWSGTESSPRFPKRENGENGSIYF